MTQEEILEYNKRCAYFLDWKYIEDGDIWNPGISYNYSFIYTDNLQFHSDWNWIMEVVEAIEKLEFATKIDHDYCISNHGCDRCEIDTKQNALFQDEDREEPIVFVLTKTKKEAVVQAINQFLIWYKNNILNNEGN